LRIDTGRRFTRYREKVEKIQREGLEDRGGRLEDTE